jgi:hypothetical protein
VNHRPITLSVFAWLVLSLIGIGIARSAIATQLDGFTIDEAYHIAAGVSYVKYGDFRINPEQPPLIKLWVGSFLDLTGFHLQALRQFSDKTDERTFTEVAVFRENDPDSVQRRARLAMFGLNGLLLACLGFALRRVFNAGVAAGTLLFLIIDPTVAAHLPVVMTDLPVALLSITAVVLAIRAFREWTWPDLIACSLFLGLTLTAKHSAPVMVLSVALIGTAAVLYQPVTQLRDARWRRSMKLGAVLCGALIVLWGSYFFRYTETPLGPEMFNRTLADKIEDVNTPTYHAVLRGLSATRILPRAYVWGFADTVHAGMEGRPYAQLIFGRVYVLNGPKYFFPAMIGLKLPIGLSLLSLGGLVLFFRKRLPPESSFAVTIMLFVAIVFLLVLAKGATYAGIRHALPAVVLLSIFAGIFAEWVFASGPKSLKGAVILAFLLAASSAVPVMRPWEYFNEFIGTRNAYRYFSDDGVDLGQRTKEMGEYYRKNLKRTGEIPEVSYFTSESELKGRDTEYLGGNIDRDLSRMVSPDRSGTIFIATRSLFPSPYWDRPALREVAPAARFGNLFIFRGKFHVPGIAASSLYWYGLDKLYAAKPDEDAAQDALQRSADLAPQAYFVHIELGNLHLKHGERDLALRDYSAALNFAPPNQSIRESIQSQVERITNQPTNAIVPLRNPYLE